MPLTLRHSPVIILTILDLLAAVAMVAEVVLLVVHSLVAVEVVLVDILVQEEKERQADLVPQQPPRARVAVVEAAPIGAVMRQVLAAV